MKTKSVLLLFTALSLSAAPRLGISTNAVGAVTIAPGSNGATQTVEAFNLGDGSLNLSAASSASWLSATVGASRPCTPPRTGSCVPIAIALNTSTLAEGSYTEFITVSDPNAVDSPQSIAVFINVAGVPSSITAYVTPVGGMTSTTTFPIFTSGTGVQAAVTTQSGGSWLKFLSGTGGIVPATSPYLVSVAAQVGMAPGTYNGAIVLTGSSVASDNKTINVTLNVTSSPIIQLNNTSPIRLTSSVGGPIQYSSATFNNLGAGALTITGAASSAAFVKPTVSGNSVLFAADPAGLAAGTYNANVTLTSNAANNGQVTVPVQLIVAPAGQPSINPGGIVNAVNGAAEAVSVGDIVAIYGTQLAPGGTSASNPGKPPLATTLGGVQVLVNNVPAPLFYVSPGQINFQVPYSLAPGSLATVQVVSNGTPGNTRSMSIVASAPRLLYFVSFITGNYGIIVNNSDQSLTLPTGTSVPGFQTHPAKPGDVIVIYGIGFGQTTPAALEGAAASGQSITGVKATFGGGFNGIPTTANASFAGLTPTAVGLYQINITVPADTPLGNSVPVTATLNGLQSNVVYLAITATGR